MVLCRGGDTIVGKQRERGSKRASGRASREHGGFCFLFNLYRCAVSIQYCTVGRWGHRRAVVSRLPPHSRSTVDPSFGLHCPSGGSQISGHSPGVTSEKERSTKKAASWGWQTGVKRRKKRSTVLLLFTEQYLVCFALMVGCEDTDLVRCRSALDVRLVGPEATPDARLPLPPFPARIY